MNRDIWTSKAVFSLKFLLPDENISAYIRECPVWPYWTYFIDDGPGEKSWYLVPHKEKDLVFSPLIITQRELQTDSFEDVEEDCRDEAFIMIIAMISEATDYTTRKTEQEMKEMFKKFEEIKKAGPQISDID